MTKRVAAVCAAVLLLAGCGGGDDTEARDNIKTSLMGQESAALAGTKLTEEQAGCLADGMVDEIGVDQLQDYGLLDDDLSVDESSEPTDLSKEDADALASTMVGCVDFKALMLESMDSGGQLDDEQKKCLEDAINEDDLQAMLSSNFQGEDADLGSGMQSALMECMMPSGG